jgi:type III restriction enzyme
VRGVEAEADGLARTWLSQTRVARKSLTDERQAEYDRVEEMAATPERKDIAVPSTAQADTKRRNQDGTEEVLPTQPMHLLADDHGYYPVSGNEWERKVIDAEIARAGFRGWYRNPSRSSKESLAVAYQDEAGDWKAMRPDFLFFGTSHDGRVVVDIVDPHGHHLSDALPKLRGLASFAETFAAEFRRIESIAETGGKLRVLDITKPQVRAAIRGAQGAKPLYESSLASDY